MKNLANITEIFSSIQGEGPYIGYQQIFVRFAGCNLSCAYCDTDYSCNKSITAEDLLAEISVLNTPPHHSISLTGGEPLVQTDFLTKFLPELKDTKVYLETNGVLWQELSRIIGYIDIISMDIKIMSSTGIAMPFDEHKNFIETAKLHNKELFVKAVINENFEMSEIHAVAELVKDRVPLILQPMDNIYPQDKLIDVYNEFQKKSINVRIIPQTHKFMGLR